jgi:hypothetical protein
MLSALVVMIAFNGSSMAACVATADGNIWIIFEFFLRAQGLSR